MYVYIYIYIYHPGVGRGTRKALEGSTRGECDQSGLFCCLVMLCVLCMYVFVCVGYDLSICKGMRGAPNAIFAHVGMCGGRAVGRFNVDVSLTVSLG